MAWAGYSRLRQIGKTHQATLRNDMVAGEPHTDEVINHRRRPWRNDMQGVKDASGLYDVERRAYHAVRPGFRITELQIGPAQKVPWHYHTNVHDTFYVVAGSIRVFLQDPKEEVRLTPGQTFAVPPKRPHLVTNAGDASAVFLVLQGIGAYDFVPLT
jgi:mannose-6-phosphate isomerase-like protein (cupin superfamily)